MSSAPNLNLTVSASSPAQDVPPAVPTTPVATEPIRVSNSGATQPQLSNQEITNSPLEKYERNNNSEEILVDHTEPKVRDQSVRDNSNASTSTVISTNSTVQNTAVFSSIEVLLNAALSGDIDSQFELGEFYFNKNNVDVNNVKAGVYFRLAAEQGHVDAQYNLAAMYELGKGVEEDKIQAAAWYIKAAAQHHLQAQYRLGLMYSSGIGVKKNYSEAINFLSKSANRGHADAQYELGCMHALGKGIVTDNSKAFDWYLKSALQGNLFAQFDVGLAYFTGAVVRRDIDLAKSWFIKSAKQGFTQAQLALVAIYLGGSEKTKDAELGTYWFLKSGLQSDDKNIIIKWIRSPSFDFRTAVKSFPAALNNYPDFRNVKNIKFFYGDFYGDTFNSVGELIRANAPFEILQLSGSSFRDADIELLGNSLHNNINLKEIIFDNKIDANLKNKFSASLAQNIAISNLLNFILDHFTKNSDVLPLEVLQILVEKIIVAYLKCGYTVEEVSHAIDEFLICSSINSVIADLKKY